MSFHPSLQSALAAQSINNIINNRININNNNINNANHNANINTLRYAALMTRPQSSSSAPVRVSPPPLQSSSALNTIKQTWPFPKKQQLSQVFIKLKRNSIQDSWGIVFTRFDNRLVLGDIQPKTQQHYTDWSVVISGSDLVDAREAFCLFQNNPEARETYRIRVKAYGHAMSLPSWHVGEQLLPGDLIVSVDGMDPMVAFPTMDQVTGYLRQALELSMVVLRHPQATAASFACYNSHLANQSALGLAAAADHIWKSLLLVAPRTTSYYHPPTVVPLVRRVTPDDQTLHQMGSGGSQQAEQQSLKSPIVSASSLYNDGSKPLPNPLKTTTPPVYHGWRNPWFQDEHGVPIPFEDNWEYSPEDGTRAHLFLPTTGDFQSWLRNRKDSWRTKYKVYKVANKRWDNGEEDCDDDDPFDRNTSSVALDFWTPQGFASFEAWLLKRKEGWRTNYKVYRNKKRKIHKECEEVVHLSDDFDRWLQVRKNQWKVHRRKRQRLRQIRQKAKASPLEKAAAASASATPIVTPEKVDLPGEDGDDEIKVAAKRPRRLFTAPPADIDMACIDDILAEEEARKKKLAERPPIDLSFLFDCNKSPDDVVIHILGFLDRKEHGKLLCINREYSDQLKARDELWRRLCPSHWILPRRPRKAWHEIYINRLRREQFDHQKRWDDLLLKCYGTITKGDQLNKIEKLVAKGEDDFGFHVNYVSPVVCERNCLLNLAVIHKRLKIVRWLLDQKGAHIESFDRGQFTPLLNAAWSGDKPMVRLLLQRGANRSNIGFFHYSKPVSSPDFEGLTAEGWARTKGFEDIAKLIHLGL
ncbi:unnamed protein product [Cylindrotheca closterium]|uniref:F-box domain-containing protein n=1 Tax=Cylindrotheca closterium TaxID=2856 RepID=A0AAD2FJH0_9STRA|nr:unnamed protein product [Cylindrotheca closterium]